MYGHNNHMLIGALIALFLSLVWISIALANLNREVERHNSNASRVRLLGKAQITIHWWFIFKPLMFIVFGLIVGYFV